MPIVQAIMARHVLERKESWISSPREDFAGLSGHGRPSGDHPPDRSSAARIPPLRRTGAGRIQVRTQHSIPSAKSTVLRNPGQAGLPGTGGGLRELNPMLEPEGKTDPDPGIDPDAGPGDLRPPASSTANAARK